MLFAVTFATQDIMPMPRAAQFHRIRKQAQRPVDKAVPGVWKNERHRLA